MSSFRLRSVYVALCAAAMMPACGLVAQAPAAARQLGTVKAMAGGVVTLTTAAGAEVSVTLPVETRVLQLPPGTTDLKAGLPAKVEDIAVGDRMLAIGAAGDTAGTLTASRVILMKSGDIAARNAAQDTDWQRRGIGGVVKAIEGTQVTVSAGARTVKLETTPKTVFKRYADDSVAFADAKPSTLTDLHTGDQMRARGALSEDRSSLTAEEVVSGTFGNFSGVVSAVDAAKSTLTLKDTATGKPVTVSFTPKSDLRKLTPEVAARFAGRSEPATGAPAAAAGGPPAGAPGGPRPRADLSQVVTRLPQVTLSELKPGDTVMLVVTEESAQHSTAITLLSGAEAILRSTPAGAKPLTLSPWTTGEPAGGGGPQ